MDGNKKTYAAPQLEVRGQVVESTLGSIVGTIEQDNPPLRP
jgi:hypothetical protein